MQRDLIAEADELFYEWEKQTYGDDSPLADDDRHVFIQGYIVGCMKEHNRATVQIQQVLKELKEGKHD